MSLITFSSLIIAMVLTRVNFSLKGERTAYFTFTGSGPKLDMRTPLAPDSQQD